MQATRESYQREPSPARTSFLVVILGIEINFSEDLQRLDLLAALYEFLQSLVAMNTKLEAGSPHRDGLLNKALHRAARLAHHDFLIVPVSDFSQADDETMKLLVKMSQHNDVLAVHVSDPMERRLPDGRIVLSDGHRQITADTGQPGMSDRYTDDFQQRLADLTDSLRRYRIPLLKVDTVRPIGRQTRDQLGHQVASRRIR